MRNCADKKITPSKEIAYVAVACAALLGGQYIFSFFSGVEIVTLLFICFCYVFGIRRGFLLAASFSLLRCFIFGFQPNVIILYLIYYPALAAGFGGLGHVRQAAFKSCPLWLALTVNALLLSLCIACALVCALDLLKISRLYRATAYALLWTVFALCLALCIAFDALFAAKRIFKKDAAQALKIITVTAFAIVFTVCFTLLDDVITPLMYGYSRITALAYFYASFTAMLPQTVCAAVTVFTLFLPLTAALKRAVK